MKILVDNEITDANKVFGHLGSVELFKGRSLTRALVKKAQVLIVRSVTKVNRELLRGSQVRFVASATSGNDHVDVNFLQENGIKFFCAVGANAKTVAEHVLCCMAEYAAEARVSLGELSVGLVGYGHVGQAVGKLLDCLSIKYCAYDPFINSHSHPLVLTDLDKVLGCDVVSLHVPLTTNGSHPTHNLIGHQSIAKLRSGALLINTARGTVLDESALIGRLSGEGKIWAAIDCWAGEPDIDPEFTQAVWRATPHIAGHSVQAKRRALMMVYQSVCNYLEVDTRRLEFIDKAESLGKLVGSADVDGILRAAHPLQYHTEGLVKASRLELPHKIAYFDDHRAKYGLRHEFSAYKEVYSGFDGGIIKALSGLGFVSESQSTIAKKS